MGSIYNLTLAGQTLAGNTSFPSTATSYTPLEAFNLSGILTFESPTIIPRNNNTDRNVADVGLYVGNVVDANVVAGEIQWASNQAVHWEFDEITGASISQFVNRVDETFQSYDDSTRTLTMSIDPSTALTSNIDSFNKRSSLFSAPVEIVGGTVTLQFSPGFDQVTGSATLIGNGFIEPGAYAWEANFSGTLAANFVGLAESV